MPLLRTIAAVTAICFVTVHAVDARDSSGFLEPSENPLLGTWLLVEQQMNPNLPIGCSNLRLSFGQQPRTYMAMSAGQIAIAQTGIIYTILDNDHIKIDALTKCTYERGPIDGTTPLIQTIETPAQPSPSGPQIAVPGPTTNPHTMTYDEAIDAIGKLGREQH